MSETVEPLGELELRHIETLHELGKVRAELKRYQDQEKKRHGGAG